jgi:hypothetical protein
MFSQQHYNFLAKRFRENLGPYFNPSDYEERGENAQTMLSIRTAMVVLVIDLAKHFKEDNPRFDTLMFLDACSPDPEVYPFSELVEGE